MSKHMSQHPPHWLTRPRTVRGLWLTLACLLCASVIAGLMIEQHAHFGIEASPGFYAWFGFAACVAMVLFAKLLGIFLKRPEDYYRPEQAPEQAPGKAPERTDD